MRLGYRLQKTTHSRCGDDDDDGNGNDADNDDDVTKILGSSPFISIMGSDVDVKSIVFK